jgi:hypothetical protein
VSVLINSYESTNEFFQQRENILCDYNNLRKAAGEVGSLIKSFLYAVREWLSRSEGLGKFRRLDAKFNNLTVAGC